MHSCNWTTHCWQAQSVRRGEERRGEERRGGEGRREERGERKTLPRREAHKQRAIERERERERQAEWGRGRDGKVNVEENDYASDNFRADNEDDGVVQMTVVMTMTMMMMTEMAKTMVNTEMMTV